MNNIVNKTLYVLSYVALGLIPILCARMVGISIQAVYSGWTAIAFGLLQVKTSGRFAYALLGLLFAFVVFLYLYFSGKMDLLKKYIIFYAVYTAIFMVISMAFFVGAEYDISEFFGWVCCFSIYALVLWLFLYGKIER
ncbi:MAG: hypothetical protein J6P93_03150 [Alphaproteobacteria bacterium]|nr:hypothetical protein [Alphaproteobacteria bacterium]